MSSPEQLFEDRLAADPSRPLVTFYDDATQERSELSAKSMANWVAKTHFLIMDSLGLGPGDRAALALPLHWLAAPILFGCWFAGLEIVTDPTQANVVFGDAGSLEGLELAGADEVFAVSMLSMASATSPPAGMTDYTTAVRPQPDSWAGVRAQAGEADAAWNGSSRAQVAAQAHQRAGALGLTTGARLLWSRSPDWLDCLLAPMSVGGSTVLVRHPDPEQRARHAAAENATVLC